MAQDKGGRAPGMELLEEALSLVMNRKKAGEAVDRMEEAFGSLAAVFRAPQGQLEDVAQLEEVPRRYLQLTLELARAYLEDQAGQMLRIYDLRSRADAFRPKFLGKKNEIVCLMLLDGRGHLRYNDVLLEGSVSEVPIYLRKIVRLCIEYQVQQVVLAHNHPSGNPAPSRGDMLATCRVALAPGEHRRPAGGPPDLHRGRHVLLPGKRHAGVYPPAQPLPAQGDVDGVGGDL